MSTVYYPYKVYYRKWGSPKSAERAIKVVAKDRKQAKRIALIALQNKGGAKRAVTRVVLA